MRNIPDNNVCSVYPGEYIPLWETEAMLKELRAGNNPASSPLINMNEWKDCFTVDVMLPGVKREDIFLHAHNNILSIVVLHKNPGKLVRSTSQVHEFDGEYFERHILLPGNADTEFISAEYREGILRLHVPKANESSSTTSRMIVVY